MSEVDASFVRRGLWTNVDQGDIMGKTITTDSTTGAIVIALMAVLSTMGSSHPPRFIDDFLRYTGTSHLWNILLFVYHQMRADGRPSDGLLLQQQALLRTQLPPGSLMAESTKLWWYWRKRNEKVLTRSLIQFFLATSCTVVFVTASIASSFVVNNSDLEVLVRSPLCGNVDIAASISDDVNRNYVAAINTASIPYAEECYQNKKLLPTRCKAYVHPRISFTTEQAACPFDVKFCVANTSTTNSAIALDSGLVDLNAGFGLNLPKKDRVSYRRRTTCAVLPLGGRTTVVNGSDFPDALQAVPDIIPNEQLLLMHYGDRPALGEWKNTTVLYSLLRGNFSKRYTMRLVLQFCCYYISYHANSLRNAQYIPALNQHDLGNDFVPLEGLHRDDADTVLKFLGSPIRYSHPVDDPWFSAHQAVTTFSPANGRNYTQYLPDSPLTGIGCSVQVCPELSHIVTRQLIDHSINFASEHPLVTIVPS
jgi:hypothetical protein